MDSQCCVCSEFPAALGRRLVRCAAECVDGTLCLACAETWWAGYDRPCPICRCPQRLGGDPPELLIVTEPRNPPPVPEDPIDWSGFEGRLPAYRDEEQDHDWEPSRWELEDTDTGESSEGESSEGDADEGGSVV